MKKLLLILLVLAYPSFAQKKIRTLEVSDTIIYATVDRPGELYVITKSGQFQKFDEDGKLLVVYKNPAAPTLFDARDGARLFSYYRKDQVYQYLNPSFNATASYQIDSAFVIQPWLICPSGDHKLWVLDAADHSLKKINVRESEVEVEVVIDTTLISDATTFKSMREYQGFVFLYDPAKGILIFNTLGKHIKTLDVRGIHSFNFLGEELYYLHNKKIRFFDLFSADTREKDLDTNASAVILTDRRMFLVKTVSIEILEFTP